MKIEGQKVGKLFVKVLNETHSFESLNGNCLVTFCLRSSTSPFLFVPENLVIPTFSLRVETVKA